MNFVGLKKETDRAAVIELLRLASASPLSKPTPQLVENESTPEVEVTPQSLSLKTKEKDHGGEVH